MGLYLRSVPWDLHRGSLFGFSQLEDSGIMSLKMLVSLKTIFCFIHRLLPQYLTCGRLIE